jgi:hypothetical protein
VVPHLGDVRLQQVSAHQLNLFYALLLEKGRVKTDNNIVMYRYWADQQANGIDPKPADLVRECGVGYHTARSALRRYRQGRIPTELKPGLSPKTVRNVHVMLHRAFTDAKRWRYVVDNPVSEVKPPRVSRRRSTVWTADQVRQFLLCHCANGSVLWAVLARGHYGYASIGAVRAALGCVGSRCGLSVDAGGPGGRGGACPDQ